MNIDWKRDYKYPSFFLNRIRDITLKFYQLISKRTEESDRQLIIFGIIMSINFPLYHIIWRFFDYQSYENFILRLTASILCLLLIIKDYWPNFIKKYLPLFWYFTAGYCLPFFFAFMTLKNHASTIWLMNCVSVIFFLLLLFDLLSVCILMIIGGGIGWAVYLITDKTHFYFDAGIINTPGIFATFGAAFLIGAIFAHNKQLIQNAKLDGMLVVGASVAHELRTPLATLNLSVSSMKKKIQRFKQKTVNSEINMHDFELLDDQLNSINKEVIASFTIIDMLLLNLNPEINQSRVETFSISYCIDEALSRYPFIGKQKELIEWKKEVENDFIVSGESLFVIHVLFNLLKNSLYYIAKAGKGNIEIWLEKTNSSKKLYFKDTGSGMQASILPHIFEKYFTKTYHGAGIGLTFCKGVMERLGGGITCESVNGVYTLFILSFPVSK